MKAPTATTEQLERIEALATALAAEAGAFVVEQLQLEVLVEYKTDGKGKENTSDPVSEVDRAVEALLRERVGAEFPDHVVVGEEDDVQPAPDTEFVWVLDPVDGTANFVNGFPLFAVSIGVLQHGRPVVGAVWCATTHALNHGVYHAHEGGPLCLDDREVIPERATKVKRALAAAPGGSVAGTKAWDHRVTGSMAIEGAYVAAGVFAAAPFWVPKIWDVAAAVVLVRAAGREAWTRDRDGWKPFECFEAPAKLPSNVKEERAPSVRDWRGAIVVGTPEGVALIKERQRKPSFWRRVVGGGRS